MKEFYWLTIGTLITTGLCLAAYSDGQTSVERMLQRGQTIVINRTLYKCETQEIK